LRDAVGSDGFDALRRLLLALTEEPGED
jgi:hypothetical protein